MDAIERGVKDVLFRCTNQLARAWDTYKAAIDKLLNNQCRTLTPIEVTLLLYRHSFFVKQR